VLLSWAKRLSPAPVFCLHLRLGDHPLLVEWHGPATVSIYNSVWEFVKGFLEDISTIRYDMIMCI